MRILFTIVLLLTISLGKTQLLDSIALDSARWYTTISSALQNPEVVYKLKLSKRKLKDFPPEILQFHNLNILDLSKNKIVSIPDSIAALHFLQEINFSRNNLEEFSPAIGKLTNLVYLNLNQNHIIEIPAEIKNLVKLEVLDMWSNDLAIFPVELSMLKNLKRVDFRMILINKEQQQRISKLMPDVHIFMDLPCSCKE